MENTFEGDDHRRGAEAQRAEIGSPPRLSVSAVHPGWALWLTGPPAAGKTTIARALHRTLAARGIVAALLDSDELRPIIAPGAGYGPADRDDFYARLVALAATLTGDGVNVIIAATGQCRAYRDAARARLAPFAEVFVAAPLAVCAARDPKGLYARARAGAISSLPGADAPYEPPLHPEVTVDTTALSVDAAVRVVCGAVPWLMAAG